MSDSELGHECTMNSNVIVAITLGVCSPWLSTLYAGCSCVLTMCMLIKNNIHTNHKVQDNHDVVQKKAPSEAALQPPPQARHKAISLGAYMLHCH